MREKPKPLHTRVSDSAWSVVLFPMKVLVVVYFLLRDCEERYYFWLDSKKPKAEKTK